MKVVISEVVDAREAILDCGHFVDREIKPRTCDHQDCGFTFCSEDCTAIDGCEYCEAVLCPDHLVETFDGLNTWKICANCKAEEEKEQAWRF